jgi:pyruvate/2-oxoglutarate dehydrogenase complex dihydrolipoamide dehydrogenase (E3) component
MYRRFGSEVTVIERGPRLLSRDDEDVADAIRSFLEGEGVRIVTGAKIARIESQANEAIVHLHAGAPIGGSHLLVAVGRQPNTFDLGLDKAGVATDARGYVQVDDELRTTAPGVWALGDCNGKGAFTHTSYNDYQIVAANLLAGEHRTVKDRITAYALYTDPPLGRCGMTEREVRASGRPALVAKMPMTQVGRARERGETLGFMKVVVDAETKRILGASLLGIEADEVVHVILDVMYAGAPYTLIERAMHIHPTVSELLPTLFGQLKPL